MNKNFMNKFNMKILSLIIAFLIWLVIGNIQDPVSNITFYDIPVKIVNQSYLAEKLEIPLPVEGKDTVSVRIRAEKSVLKNLKKENITAEADVTQIVDMQTDPLMVPVKITCPGVSEDKITVSPGNIPINIEEQISVEKVISTSYDNTPDKNYEVGKIRAIPEKVTISGPSTLVNIIDRVVATVDVTGMAKSDILKSGLKIYDKNQVVLDDKQMAYLDLKGVKNNEVNVQVDLWKITEAAIEVEYSGVPKYGYEVNSVTTVPDVISIAGTEEALKELKENGNVLKIPGEYINVTGKSTDFVQNVDLSELLPDNIILARDINSSVIVTVKILPYNSREYMVSAARIESVNKAENVDVTFEQETIAVRVRGKNEDLNKLLPANIQLKIDLSEYQQGEYEVPVEVTLPSGYALVEEIKVKVKLVQAAETVVQE